MKFFDASLRSDSQFKHTHISIVMSLFKLVIYSFLITFLANDN